jgi:hypothetical protein
MIAYRKTGHQLASPSNPVMDFKNAQVENQSLLSSTRNIIENAVNEWDNAPWKQ